jgi:hypothetical protein
MHFAGTWIGEAGINATFRQSRKYGIVPVHLDRPP